MSDMVVELVVTPVTSTDFLACRTYCNMTRMLVPVAALLIEKFLYGESVFQTRMNSLIRTTETAAVYETLYPIRPVL